MHARGARIDRNAGLNEHALRHSGCRRRHIATALKGMHVPMWRLTTASLHKQSNYRLLTSNNPPFLRPRAACYSNWNAGGKGTTIQALQTPSYPTQESTKPTNRAANTNRSAQLMAGFSLIRFRKPSVLRRETSSPQSCKCSNS